MAESGERMADGRRIRIGSVIVAALAVAALGLEAVRCASFVRPLRWGGVADWPSAREYAPVRGKLRSGQMTLRIGPPFRSAVAFPAYTHRDFLLFSYVRERPMVPGGYRLGAPRAKSRVVLVAADLWKWEALLGVCAAIAYWRGPRRRRVRYARGRCIGCGYDLTGNTSGVCSECGRTIAGSPPGIPWGQRTAGVAVLVLALASVAVGSFTNVLVPVRQQVLMGLVLLVVGAELARARVVGILVAALGVCMAVLGACRSASLGRWLLKADDPSLLITYNCCTWIGYALIGVMIVVVAVRWPRRRAAAYGQPAPSRV